MSDSDKEVRLDEETCKLLKSVVDHFYEEDRAVRERQIRHWHRLKFYWNNLSQIYWSEIAHDYRIWNASGTRGADTDQEYYDRPVNIFRAFLETIIAALSVQVPAISCVPEDADNPIDLSTAKAGDKISEQIYKHNDVIFLWLQALYIHCTEGLIACYSYSKDDKKYGTYRKPKMKNEEIEAHICPNCGNRLEDTIFSATEMAEFDPDNDDIELHDIIEKKGPVCPECGVELDPNLQKSKLVIPRIVGFTDELKSRICLEVYGGLYIKVANYAKKQEDTPYLSFSYETHYANALECYPELWNKIPHGGWTNTGPNDPYEQYGRLNTQYRGEYPQDNVTVKNVWLRHAAFNILEREHSNKLKKKFPDGCRVAMINDIVAEYENEALDDHWTLTRNPMSDFLNHEPLGELLTNIQDITNDLISLTLQTIEHGIEQLWADPAVVNFNAQSQIEAMPGTISATKPVSGSRNIGEAFYASKSAALAPEVLQLFRVVQELGQFVSGALPSLFGGSQGKGASKTASEYAMSRSMALQRLQTPWKMLTIWWKGIFGKVIPMYMKNMNEDEKYVSKDEFGNFINVFIRKAEIGGKIGSVELEASEQLPLTDEQQKQIMLELMQLNNQEINSALLSSENLPFLRKLIKIPQFKLPGEDDRQKQYEEINELINSQPIPSGQIGPDGQKIELPSVQVDPLVDNNEIEAKTCRSWAIGDAGRLAKIENPEGYKNVLLHMKQHMDIIQQNLMAQQQMAAASASAGSAENSSGVPANGGQPETINGEADVKAPIS